MSVTLDQLRASVSTEAGNELQSALDKINHCIDQLTDDQIWWRGDASMNSIGNLILHLGGNLRQWIVAGIGGAEDIRQRPKEFAQQVPIAKSELQQQLEAVVSEAKRVLADASATELLRVRRIQGFDVTGMQAVFESVAHFRGHCQEIVHLTRRQIGEAYRFDFVPATPDQGAD